LLEGRPLAASILGDQRFDDLGVDHRAALRDRTDRRHELLDVLDALLQEIGAARAAALQECEGVARGGVLTEHDHAGLGVRLAQACGRLDPLIGVTGRHADVGNDDVRLLRLHRDEKRVEVVAHRRDLDAGLRLEQPPDALADDVVVLREHHADRHSRRIRWCPSP
jgi:hypothetical protein